MIIHNICILYVYVHIRNGMNLSLPLTAMAKIVGHTDRANGLEEGKKLYSKLKRCCPEESVRLSKAMRG